MSLKLTGKRKLLVAGALAGFLVYAWLGPKFIWNKHSASQHIVSSNSVETSPSQATSQSTPNVNIDETIELNSVNTVAANELIKWMPQLLDQPVVIAFKSKYCHDCQQMAPILQSLSEDHPGIDYLAIDVMRDKKEFGAVINAFEPSVVPVTLFIQRGGKVVATLTGLQDKDALSPYFSTLNNAPAQDAIVAPPVKS